MGHNPLGPEDHFPEAQDMEMDEDTDPAVPPSWTPTHLIEISDGSSFHGSSYRGPDSYEARLAQYDWVFTPSYHSAPQQQQQQDPSEDSRFVAVTPPPPPPPADTNYNYAEVDPYLVAANYNALHPEGPYEGPWTTGYPTYGYQYPPPPQPLQPQPPQIQPPQQQEILQRLSQVEREVREEHRSHRGFLKGLQSSYMAESEEINSHPRENHDTTRINIVGAELQTLIDNAITRALDRRDNESSGTRSKTLSAPHSKSHPKTHSEAHSKPPSKHHESQKDDDRHSSNQHSVPSKKILDEMDTVVDISECAERDIVKSAADLSLYLTLDAVRLRSLKSSEEGKRKREDDNSRCSDKKHKGNTNHKKNSGSNKGNQQTDEKPKCKTFQKRHFGKCRCESLTTIPIAELKGESEDEFANKESGDYPGGTCGACGQVSILEAKSTDA
ncbi:uncharacterized protein LOC110875746 [Helianthus annuus]|uniref:uncharacterized protein LOC110875746 n=1 Tax=Helianthus annuus TaxID=4232 RepID=UPI000B8F25BA|nr:uncharacterized protein LOC110875746 [Helianthus annuus]